MPGKLFAGCICCHESCDFDNIIICCKNKGECFCVVQEACIDINEEPLGCGNVPSAENKECCKLGLHCFAVGCKQPETCCVGASQCFFLKNVHSFPFHEEYLKDCVCSYYCLTCAPELGCCVDTPPVPALEKPLKLYGPIKNENFDDEYPMEEPMEDMERE